MVLDQGCRAGDVARALREPQVCSCHDSQFEEGVLHHWGEKAGQVIVQGLHQVQGGVQETCDAKDEPPS